MLPVPARDNTNRNKPQTGELLYYLVSGKNSCVGGEGSLGFSTPGAERPNDTPCPTLGNDTDGDQVPDIDDNAFEERPDVRP